MILRILKQIFLFPLDLIYLTVDAWIIGSRYMVRLFRKEKEQRCHFCQGDDYTEPDHAVRSVLKYQNIWLVRLVSPCIREKRSGKRRHTYCVREGGYTKASPAAPVLAVGMPCFWALLLFGSLYLLSSDRDNFASNFITFFSPQRTMGGGDELDFLELGDVRLNPERAERYYTSGRRHFDQQNFQNAEVDFKIAIQNNPTDARSHYFLGRSLLMRGQLTHGEASIRRALEFNEEHVEALLIMAELLERREARGEALARANKALELEPNNVRAVRMGAALAASMGDAERTRTLADQLLTLDPEEPATLAFLGRLEFNVFQDPDSARERLEAALEKNPDHVDSLLAMIPLHAMQQDVEKVDATLARVIELQPDNLQARRLEAELLMSRYGLSVGLRAYNNLLTRFAGDLSIRLRYAELLLQAGRISEGRRLAQQLTSSRVPAIERSSHWMLAQMYSQMRMFDEAIDHAQRALDRTPGARNIQAFLAQTFLQSNRPTDARRLLELAMVDHPNDFGLISMYSQALVLLGETNDAINFLSRRLSENPDADAIRLRLVEVKMQSPRWRESLADTRLLHEKYPERPELANNLAFLLARSGQDLDYALSLMEPLMEQFGENPVIMDTYAYVLAAQGRHEEALPILEEALARAQANPTIRFHLAQTLAALGRSQEARNHLEAVLIIDPNFQQADEIRQTLATLQSGAST